MFQMNTGKDRQPKFKTPKLTSPVTKHHIHIATSPKGPDSSGPMDRAHITDGANLPTITRAKRGIIL